MKGFNNIYEYNLFPASVVSEQRVSLETQGSTDFFQDIKVLGTNPPAVRTLNSLEKK